MKLLMFDSFDLIHRLPILLLFFLDPQNAKGKKPFITRESIMLKQLNDSATDIPQGFETIYSNVYEICNRKLSLDYKQSSQGSNKCEFELEARLGKLIIDEQTNKTRFVSGVDDQLFFAIETMLLHGEWDMIYKWTNITDFLYQPHNVSITNVSQYDTLRISNIGGNQRDHLVKKTLERNDFKNIGDVTNGYDVRISLSQELKISPDDLSVVKTPFKVRIKHRESFFLVEPLFEGSKTNVRYRYDLTLVWNGETKSEAETKQMNEIPPDSYEIEIECEGVNSFSEVDYDKPLVDYLTRSLMFKLSNLVSISSKFISIQQNKQISEMELSNDD